MEPVIEHIHEPKSLHVAWQPENPDDRRRRVIGQLLRTGDSIELKYAVNTEDFKKAVEYGFQGIPPFPINKDKSYSKNVPEYLEKRLPIASRSDYSKFLNNYGLPSDAEISLFGLLGYTEGQLPADWFSFIHPFDVEGPCEFVTEVAGTRHYCNTDNLRELVGRDVLFVEENNEHEPTGTAFRIMIGDSQIGHVNRVHLDRFRDWSQGRNVSGSLIRVNGTADRPRAFVFVRVI